MPLTIDLSPAGFVLTDETGHFIEIPNSLSGLVFLHSLLKARQEWGARAPTIGTQAAPTQAMVRAFLDTHKVQVPAGKTAAQINAELSRKPRQVDHDLDLATEKLFNSLDLELDL